MNWTRWFRGTILVIAVLYMQAGSFLRMGVGVPTTSAMQSWRMYNSRAHDQCKLWVFEQDAQGEATPIDWTGRLGLGLGSSKRRVSSRDEAKRLVQRVCQVSPVGAELSYEVQCARKRRWRQPSKTRDVVLCTGRGK